MKFKLIVCFCLLCLTASAQLDKLRLKNVLIVAQLDKQEDRFTMEVNLSEILADCGIKTTASLNVLKQGAPITMLGMDSVIQAQKTAGIDTYVLISVRGYDNRFKPATIHQNLKEELETGHLFPLYRDQTTSVSFEFNFYRDGQFVAYDMVKLGNIGERDDVLKKLRKKLPRRIIRKWK